MTISAWAYEARLVSPDGRFVAEVVDLNEVAMGAPTRGTLRVSNGLIRESCGPSVVWSVDSEYLAVPQWTSRRDQRLVVLSMSRREARYAPGEYRVLELAGFEGGVVRGVDSPIHMPRPVEVDVERLGW